MSVYCGVPKGSSIILEMTSPKDAIDWGFQEHINIFDLSDGTYRAILKGTTAGELTAIVFLEEIAVTKFDFKLLPGLAELSTCKFTAVASVVSADEAAEGLQAQLELFDRYGNPTTFSRGYLNY